MKSYSLIASLFSLAGHALAQNDAYVVSQQGVVNLLPLYQSWSVGDGVKFSEASAAISLYTPLSRVASVSIRAAGGGSSGDVTKLSGLADGQVSASYHLERANVVLSLGVNLPSGKKKLTQEEFETSGLISNPIFHMQVPNFGTGFNIDPGIIWAMPVSETVVLGLGASYQYKGKFQPLEEFGDYDPGDEILVTGGVDARLSEGTTLSADLVFTAYGKDKLDGTDVFAAGRKIVVNAQFRKQFTVDELWLLARYRSRGKAQMQLGNIFATEDEKTEPDQFEFSASYTIGINNSFSLSILAEGRFYQETPADFSGVTLGGVGLAPTFKVSENLSIPARFKFFTGTTKNDKTLTGVEAGVGVIIGF
ncbi:MAG: hypothetical protein HW412_1337 [Bacteroidetes bacterium]|nr:hypothetical protein [Bacteroidota bacterium]